jgi:hypothetical protein
MSIMDLLRALSRMLVLAGLVTLPLARSANAATNSPGRFDPVANARAIVTVGHARFTILTPQLIRMEWSADGTFEDTPPWCF